MKNFKIRNIVLILGDQLSFDNSVFKNFDSSQDLVVMIESASESKLVFTNKTKIVLFLSAMRHFINEVAKRKMPYEYIEISNNFGKSYFDHLDNIIKKYNPSSLLMIQPGEYRILESIKKVCKKNNLLIKILDDKHFLCTLEEFFSWADGKKELRMEQFYRFMRKKKSILMSNNLPINGKWNFDNSNRSSYPKKIGPGFIPKPASFSPNKITEEVIGLVNKFFPNHPGDLKFFDWPVSRNDALIALENFIDTRLINFGKYQDAMWTNTPKGWHSLLSSSLNLHLLNPLEVVKVAEKSFTKHLSSIESVEGFIRQILGWREFMRGVYWLDMPKMKNDNFFSHQKSLPKWFWNGDTKMLCMRDTLSQTLNLGYAHHIQRLMIIGNFALLSEVLPKEICDWFLAVYVDAVEWVELPNTAGMAIHACGTRFTTKPYVSTGAYISKQSNYCNNCMYNPKLRYGEKACPFTTLYWHFLDKNKFSFSKNPRTSLMMKNLDRFNNTEKLYINRHAEKTLSSVENI